MLADDDVPFAVRGEELEQSCPAPDIAPTDVDWDDGNSFTLCEDADVNGLGYDRIPHSAHGRLGVRCPQGTPDLFQLRREDRLIAGELFPERSALPRKYPAVPVILAGGAETRRGCLIRFLHEWADAIGRLAVRRNTFAAVDIAIA